MRSLTVVALAGIIAVTCAQADAPTFAPPDIPQADAEVPTEVLRDWQTFHLEADGRRVEDTDSIVLIRTERGVHEHAQATFTYPESRETFEVLEAYTETADGRRLAVAADKILTREHPVAAGAPMFADVKVTTVIFPGVDVHSKLHCRTRRTIRETLFSGYFQLTDFLSPHQLNDDDRITVYAAAGTTFKSDIRGYQGGPITCPAEEQGRKCYAWSARNTAFAPTEDGSVSAEDYGQHVILGNFPSYEALAKAYWDRAADKVKVTPEIQTLADQLTSGVSDPKAQAEALYNWVARNIRYVAISIGLGGIVPRAAATVLQNRYGDCKDHVTLLQALLAARHIDSVGVLVGVDRRWTVPEVPGLIFNHIITYIPALHLYADSTSEFSRFGELPSIYVGKPGLKTQPVAGTKQFEPITSTLSEGQMTTSVEMQITDDGGASGTAEMHSAGVSEIALRSIFSRLPPGQEQTVARAQLASVNESGSGAFVHSDPHDLDKPFVYSTTFTITNLVALPGPGAFPVPSGLRLLPVADLARVTPLAQRRYPWICGTPGERRETTHLRLPASVRLAAAPRDVHVHNDFGRYDAHYEQNGNALTITREFAHTFTGQPCDDASYQQFRQLTQAIERDVKAQYLFQ
jgi:transglutaminase-like putative cysteine protease